MTRKIKVIQISKIALSLFFWLFFLTYSANSQSALYNYSITNQLLSIVYSNGDQKIYTYDEIGNRISRTITHPTSKSWIGIIDENWNKPGNWSPFGIPQAIDDVSIPATAPFMPIVKVQGLSCHNMSIDTGASVIIQQGLILTINGTLTLKAH